MSRKLLFIIIVPAVLLIAGYLALQFYLRSGVKKENEKLGQRYGNMDSLTAKSDTLGGKKASALDLRPLFIERLQQLLKKSSNGLYNLSIGDLKVDVTASTISLKDVTLRPDEKVLENLKAAGLLPDDIFSASFKNLLIEGVNLDDAVNSKSMDYKLIRLAGPVIEIDHRKPGEKKNKGDFTGRFLQQMEKLSIQKLVIEDGNIIVRDKQKGSTKKLADVGVVLSDILVDSASRKDKSRFLFAKQANIKFSNYSTTTKDGLYTFRLGDVAVNAAQKSVVLKNFSYGSTVSKEVFVKKQKQAKEMYGFSLPTVSITGIDWWTAFNEEAFLAKQVSTSGGKFSIYFDRNLPPKNKLGNFPNQLLAKMPVHVSIDRLRMQNLDISYEEYNPVSQQNGTIYFDNAAMTLTGLKTGVKTSTPMLVDGSALLMHKVPIKAVFRFNMKVPETGAFTASVRSGTPFDASLINAFAVPLGMMRVDKGELQKLNADISGNEASASGTVTVLYKDLKLSLLEKDKGKEALDKKDVTSFVANLFVLKKDNPKKGDEPRIVPATFKRDPEGGFLMLVWKTILVGALKTMGAPEKIAYKKYQPPKK